MRQFTKRSAAIVTGSVLAVAGGTAAFAYASGWFSGSSNTYAKTSTIGNVTAEIDLTPSADNNLYPGKAVNITNATITNPNDFPVVITGATVTAVNGKSGCSQSDAGFAFTSVASPKIIKGTHNGVALGTISLSKTAAPACAGANLTVVATLQGEIAEP